MSTQLDDASMWLDIRRNRPSLGAQIDVAEAFGASEPLRAVFDVLSDLPIALAPSSPVDDGTRGSLEPVRTGIAQSVVSRSELVELGRPPLWDSIEPIDPPESDSRPID